METEDFDYYYSHKTFGDLLFRRARYGDALNAYNEAIAHNPRSRTIFLEKARCFTNLGQCDKALRQTDKAKESARLISGRRVGPIGKNFAPDSPALGGLQGRKGSQIDVNVEENPGDLTYKCRYLLSKADALYNKGDFETALVYYHKGRKLRPRSEEFRLGVVKAEEALESLFLIGTDNSGNATQRSKKKGTVRKKKREEEARRSGEGQKGEAKEKPASQTKYASETKDKEASSGEAGKDSTGEGKDGQGSQDDKEKSGDNHKQGDEQNKEKGAEETDGAKAEEAEKTEEDVAKGEGEQQNEAEKADLPKPESPFHLNRQERIKEMRAMYAIRERREARKTRLKMQMLTRPSGHLQNDREFLQVLYKDFMQSSPRERRRKSRRVARDAREAIHYLDSRNRFWKQQIPHHIREKSLVMRKTGRDPSRTGPPPTQAMYNFAVKEMVRINNMLQKNQFRRCIDNAKKLMEHLGNLERGIPNQFDIMANLMSITGQAYLELGDYKKSLAFHMKDLELSTEHDLEEAKSRALDNTGRVFARTGEFAKAIAVWEEKLESPVPVPAGERAWLCHELGYCYIEIEEFAKAFDSGRKALSAAKEAGDKTWQLNANILCAQAKLHLGDPVRAKEAFEQAAAIADELGDDAAKESITPAIKELNQVVEQWKAEGRDLSTPNPATATDSNTQQKESTPKSQSDWLLSDESGGTNEDSEPRKTHKSKRDSKTVTATYVGDKDSDFYITPSGEETTDEKTDTAQAASPNSSAVKKPPSGRPAQGKGLNSPSKSVHGTSDGLHSPQYSPSYSVRNNNSIAQRSIRDKLPSKSDRSAPLSSISRKAGSNVHFYSLQRELSNSSFQRVRPVETSAASTDRKRKHNSAERDSENPTDTASRRNSVTVGIGGSVRTD